MKVRARFTKLGKIRFLSHRDLARVWERGLRRAGVAVAYSEGFSPRPRLSFGLALSTSHESVGEYLDIDLAADAGVDATDVPALVSAHLPEGMDVLAAVPLAPGSPSLQQAVVECSWRIEVLGATAPDLAERTSAALASPSLPVIVERKGADVPIDARTAIVHLHTPEPTDAAPAAPVLEATLATQPRSLRPAELLRSLDATWREGRVLRTNQWTLVDGARCEPIPVGDLGARGATSTPHATVRAS